MESRDYLEDVVFLGKMKFKDFLCESFIPKKINFGTNLINKKFKKLEKYVYVTFFETSNNDLYSIIFSKNILGFGINFKEIDIKNINSFQILVNYFSFKPRAVPNALKIFNEIIYICIQFINKMKPKYFYFSGFTDNLKKLYFSMIHDKTFLRILDEINYKYIGYKIKNGQKDPVHEFKRIKNEI